MEPLDNMDLLHRDKRFLELTKVPVVTVAASFRDDLARVHGLSEYFGDDQDEVLFSRAHYSMALAALTAEWSTQMDPKKAWGVDPTNYVSREDWGKIEFTEEMGKLVARFSLLRMLKSALDSRVRQKLPITKAITTPLLYLFEHVHRPILSFHYESGNILAAAGKQVVQVVTDPHIREQYLDHAELPTIRFCVFDENTKTSLLELADVLGKKVDPRRVVVTGPPVDPRIVAARKKKTPQAHTKRALRLCITTGGLGNNKQEIETCVRSLAPLLRGTGKRQIQLLAYAGVHEDIRESIHDIALQEGIPTAEAKESDAPLRILFSPHIVDANELLVKYAFPWADCFVTKPSGDMAYDAAAAGCSILTLEPWGEWEENIRDVFEQLGVSRRALPKDFSKQVESLIEKKDGVSWMEESIQKALDIPSLYTNGIKNILKQMPR